MDPQLLRSFKIKQGSIRCVCILDDNSFAVAGTSLGSVLLFPLENRLRPKQLTGHQDVVTCIEPLIDSSFFLTGSKDGTVRIWRDQDSTVLRPNDGPIKTISVSEKSSLTSGSVVLIVGKNGSPTVWDIDRCEKLSKLPNHEQITCGVISHDGAICMTGSSDGVCRFFDSASGKMVRSFKAAAGIECVSLSENSPYAAAGCKDGDVTLFNFKLNEVQAESQVHDGPVIAIHFHPIMNLLITGSKDTKVEICNASTLKIRYTLEGHSNPVRSVRWSPDGDKLISCDDEQGILILTSPGDDLSENGEEEDEITESHKSAVEEEERFSYVNKSKSTATYTDSSDDENENCAAAAADSLPKTEEQLKIEKIKLILAQILELKRVLFSMDERVSAINEKITLIQSAQEEENIIIRSNIQ